MTKMRNDIKTSENAIGGRQGWAYVCNSGRFVVLKADLDKEQEYDDFKEYGTVRVVWNYRGRENYHATTLAWNACHGTARWELCSGGCCLSSSFGVYDAVEMIEETQAPIVRAGDIVAIASYSVDSDYKMAELRLFKISDRIDIHCQVTATLIPLTEEEMKQVAIDADKWCNR